MTKDRKIIDEVEKHAIEMDELGSEIEKFCKLVEEGISNCQTPPISIDIAEVPLRVAKRHASN